MRITLSNVRTWRELDLEFPAGVCAVVGENGAGKSTIVNAIEWALYANGSRDLAPLLTRDSGETELMLALEFDHMGERYRVRRGYSSRGGGKATFELERLVVPQAMYVGTSSPVDEWATLNRETTGKTQELLDELLGMSRATFRASCFLAQADGAAFTMAGPARRQEILGEVLGLGVYEQLREHVAGLRGEAEQRAARHLAEVEVGEANMLGYETAASTHALAAQEVEQAQQALTDVEAGLAGARDRLASALPARDRYAAAEQALGSAQAAQRGVQAQIDGLVAKVSLGQERLEGRERLEHVAGRAPALAAFAALLESEAAAERELRELEQQLALVRSRQRDHTEAADRHGEQVAAAERRLAAVQAEAPVCPTCEQPLAGAALAAAVADVQQAVHEAEHARDTAFVAAQVSDSGAAEISAKCTAAERELNLAKAAITETGKGTEGLTSDRVQGWLAEAHAAEVQLAALGEVALQLHTDTQALEQARAELGNAGRATGEAERALAQQGVPPEVGPLEQAVAGAEALQRQAKQRADAALAAVVRAHEQLEAYARQATAIEAARTALNGAQAEVRLLKQDELMYSRKGVPALILETSAIPHMELEASRYAGDLGRGYRFELRTQKVGKTTSNVQDTLDIVVHTDTGQALYEDFSGGEKTRIDLALRIGLVSLIAASGSAAGFLAVDEPSYLDEAGFAKLAAVLRGLDQQVLVVSHVPVLRDAFDAVLEVEGGAETGVPSRLVG